MSQEKDDQRKSSSSDSSEESLSLTIGGPFKGPEESIAGTIFVNRQYRIKSIISSATELINLSSFDENLDIEDFSRQLKYEGVTDDISHVLKHQGRVQKEVPGKNGRWYVLELRPHETEDEDNGVVITFVDVTELKETADEIAENLEEIKNTSIYDKGITISCKIPIQEHSSASN